MKKIEKLDYSEEYVLRDMFMKINELVDFCNQQTSIDNKIIETI